MKPSLRWHILWLVLLFGLAVWVRMFAAQHRTSAGHGDVAAYYHVSQNLYAGRGFVQDFIADFLQDPQSVPTPSNTWWLPLPSILGWLGMVAAGEPTFVAAKRAMILVASLVVLVCYFAGLVLLRSRAGALACGILGVGFHLYLDQPTVTLSHGPYSVFAAAALLCVIAYPRHPRVLPWFGLCFGLTYLCRGDSQVLVVSLGVTLLAMHLLLRPRRPIPWRGVGGAVALFLLVVAPWWVRNARVLGEIMPSGVKKVTWARNYEEWFSDPELLTKERYLAWGNERIWKQKQIGVVDAVVYTPAVMYRSVVREGADEDDARMRSDSPKRRILWLGQYVLTPLMALGVLWLLRKRPAAVAVLLLHLLLLVVVYGIVFPAVGRESYRSSLFSVMPILLVAIVAGAGLLLWPLRRFLPRAFAVALVLVATALSAANVAATLPHLKAKAADTDNMLAPYRAFGDWWRRQNGPDAVFFVRSPWEFTAETGLRSVMMPQVAADRMLEFARRFGVTFLIDERTGGMDLGQIRRGAATLVERGDVTPVPNAPVFKLYRINKPQ